MTGEPMELDDVKRLCADMDRALGDALDRYGPARSLVAYVHPDVYNAIRLDEVRAGDDRPMLPGPLVRLIVTPHMPRDAIRFEPDARAGALFGPPESVPLWPKPATELDRFHERQAARRAGLT